MKFFKRFFEEANGNGNDLGGKPEPVVENFEGTQDPEALKIIEQMQGNAGNEGEENPEDKQEQEAETLFAGKYKTVDDLKKGIKNIGGTLPDYIINGMSDEALEQHYKELNKDFSSKKGDEKRKFEEKPKEEDKKDENEGEVAKPKWSDIDSQMRETGTITPELYDAFEKAGYDSEDVDRYAERVQNEIVSFTKNVYEVAGGEENYVKIKDWAEAGNIHPSELEAISKMPYDAMLSAMQGIKARYDVANNVTKESSVPKRIEGNTTTAPSGDAFASPAEYIKAVSDNKYMTDKAYMAEVDAKFKRSKF